MISRPVLFWAAVLTTIATVLLAASPVKASPARQALDRGDWAGALTLPTQSREERAYIRTRAHLARWELGLAKVELARVNPKSREGAELAWYVARLEGKTAARAQAAKRWCALGDSTGRACAEAELFGAKPTPKRVHLEGANVVPLAAGAPFPLALATAGEHETGFVIDSGASETVISASLARSLGLRITQASFPVGVAGGGAQAEAHLGLLPVLKLGGAKVENLPVLVMDLPQLESIGIEGIISPQQAMDGLVVTIDFASHQLRLAETPPLAGRRRARTVPYFGAGLDLAISARIGEQPAALFGLDTGMSGACAIMTEPSAPLSADKVTLNGAGAQFETTRVSAGVVKLDDFELGEGACVASPMRKSGIQLAGLLGNALWRDGTLVLDTRAHTVTIALPDEAAPPQGAIPSPPADDDGTSGI